MTAAMWLPHPDQVVLLQVRQRVGEHIFGVVLSVVLGVGELKTGAIGKRGRRQAAGPWASANSQNASYARGP